MNAGGELAGSIEPALQVDGVVYHYSGFALGPVDVTIHRGEIFGLVGPNGSGKSTLLDLVVGRRRPEEGRILIAGGQDPIDTATRRMLGYVPDSVEEVVAELTARELWRLHALAHLGRDGLAAAAERAAKAAELLDFTPPAKPISTYSQGMRRKAQIVAAGLHDPELMVLDEPTNGLDPLSAYRLGISVEASSGHGTALLVATHDLAWAQRFCHRIAAISAGQIVAVADVDEVFPSGEPLLDRFMAIVARAERPTGAGP